MAMSAWDLDLRPLGRGGGTVAGITHNSAALHWVGFDARVHQRGAPPTDTYTIGILTDTDYSLRWNGRSVDGERIEIFAPGKEYDACGPEGFGAFTVSVDRDHLDRAAHDLRVPTLFELTKGQQWVSRPRSQRFLQKFKQILADRLIEENNNSSLDHITESMLLMLSDSLPSSAVASRRQHVFRRTMELIRGLAPCENPSVSAICKSINCSISTLERAFREELGVGPKGYLLTQRLNGVRRDLLNANTEEKVSEIAIRWGFWHMGKFAADYRLAFGELPSQSLGSLRPKSAKK